MRAKNTVSCGSSSRSETKLLLARIFRLGASARPAGENCALGWVFMLALIALARPAGAAEEQDEWSRLEQEMAQQQQALEVNEGELQILEHPPEAASHFHHTRLSITEQSLRNGWVKMYQCHSDLDKVDSSQIVYQAEKISNIRVLSTQNISSVWVEGHTVQMKGIASGSKICLSADRRALSNEEGRYYLRLGPFIRRFLDGYYPMHVRVEVCYPDALELVSSSPVNAIRRVKDNIRCADIDVWVVGELNMEFVFVDAR